MHIYVCALYLSCRITEKGVVITFCAFSTCTITIISVQTMGFWNSFKNQVGRDTGRTFSNFLWKGKQASVHRHIIENNGISSDPYSSQLNEIANAKILEDLWDRIEDRLTTEQLTEKIEQKIQLLDEIPVPKDENEFINSLHQLLYLLKTNSFKDITDETNKLKNSYTEAILAKYEQFLVILEIQYPNNIMIPYFEKKLKSQRIKRFCQKYIMFIIALIAIIIGLICSLLDI